MGKKLGILAAAAALAVSVAAAVASPFRTVLTPTIEQGISITPLEQVVWRAFGPLFRWLVEPFKAQALQYFAAHLDTAYQTQYRQEWVNGFEARATLLRPCVTTEATIKGQTVVFLVADSGGATAVTRGVNGLIPARADNNNQFSAILQEWHDLVRKTGFNVFASQGDQRRIMQQTSMGVINRKIDDTIIQELNNGTVTIGGAGQVPNVSMFQNARVKLSNASVPWDSNITLLCQPSFLAYLEQAPEFANAQYVDIRPYAGNAPDWRDAPMAYRWRNALIVEHPNLPGKGTSSEKSFLFHKSAIGHAANTGEVDTAIGYNDEQNYSYARCSIFMAAKLLQNAGDVVITHDGSAYA